MWIFYLNLILLVLVLSQLVFFKIYSPAKGAEEEEEEDAWDWAKQPPLNSKSIDMRGDGSPIASRIPDFCGLLLA
jgi:hypothetical protein